MKCSWDLVGPGIPWDTVLMLRVSRPIPVLLAVMEGDVELKTQPGWEHIRQVH